MVAEMGPGGVRHQVAEHLAMQMNQVFMVARFEVHLGLLKKGRFDHHVDPVWLTDRRDCPAFTIGKRRLDLFLRQHLQVTRQHLVYPIEFEAVGRRNHCKKVTVFVTQQDRLGDLITWNMCGLGRAHSGVRMWMLDDFVSYASALQVLPECRCNTHGWILQSFEHTHAADPLHQAPDIRPGTTGLNRCYEV